MKCSIGMETRFHKSGYALLVLVFKWGDKTGFLRRRFQHVDEQPLRAMSGNRAKSSDPTMRLFRLLAVGVKYLSIGVYQTGPILFVTRKYS